MIHFGNNKESEKTVDASGISDTFSWSIETALQHFGNGVVVDLGFTTILTPQVINVAFYSECEKSDNFGLRFFYEP